MFERFSLPDLAGVSRRTMLGALLAGIAGLVVLLFLSQPWAALGFCAGLGIGMTNFRLIQRSVVNVGQRAEENKRRPLAVNTLGRMAVITAVSLGLLFIKPPLGFGVIGGMAFFQLLLLGNVTRSMLKLPAVAMVDTDEHAVGVPDDGRG